LYAGGLLLALANYFVYNVGHMPHTHPNAISTHKPTEFIRW
jgi:hypothetical protein